MEFGRLVLFVSLCVLLSEQTVSGTQTNYTHVIFVDPSNPNSTNTSDCYSSSKQKPCGDINFALAFPDRHTSTKFVLSSSVTHYLENNHMTTTFIASSQVAFYGDGNKSSATIDCMQGAGLAFINSSEISINGVSFHSCGAWRNSTSKDFTVKSFKLRQFRVGLYFYNSRDVSLVNMSVVNGTEALGVVMYSTVGRNYITHSQFIGNKISENNTESGGGGFAVEFNYCKPGDDTCDEHNHQTENNSHSVYVFENCLFTSNKGIEYSGAKSDGVSILPTNETHTSLGRGGGLSLYFKGTAYDNNITIDNCNFSRNHANWGGGLFVTFADNAIQNRVYVTKSKFVHNHCYYFKTDIGASGGGALVVSAVHYEVKKNTSYQGNFVNFYRCNFTGNRALTGGAMSLIFHFQRLSRHHQIFQANLSRCHFDFNMARLGSAVSVDHEYFYNEGVLGNMFFTSCSFFYNTIVHANQTKPYSKGIGAVYISEVQVTFQKANFFVGNNGTALALVGTRLAFREKAHMNFIDNSGSRGGAISLLGVASLLIGEQTAMVFINNSAVLFGGAIYNNYIGKEDLRSSVKCFIQYYDPFVCPSQWQATFTFIGNTAGKLGSSIYSTTILPCSWSQELQSDADIVKDIFCWNKSVWIYKDSNCSKEIYTYPQTFELGNHTNVIYPGHSFSLDITALDDLGHNVTDQTIYTAVTSNASTAEVNPHYAYVADGYVGITGKEEQDIILKLDVAGFRDWHLEVPITIEKCPPGFKPHVPTPNQTNNATPTIELNPDAKTTCECIGESDPYSFQGNLYCDKSELISKIRNGYWIGIVPKIDNTTLLMGTTSMLHRYAPQDLFPLPQQYSELDSSQCSHLHRTGPLCGECIEGYSTAVNSYNYTCVPCAGNNTNIAWNIVAYVGLTYVPYLVIFILIIIFDIRLMSGPAVGFILYAQLIGAGIFDLNIGSLPYIQAGDIPRKLQRAHKIVYGAFNLNSFSELMDPFCVYEHFNALDVICLDLAIAVFPLLLIAVIRLCLPLKSIRLRKKQRARIRDTASAAAIQSIDRKSGRTLIHPFIAFVYLSYTKFSVASTTLLSTTEVFNKDGDSDSTRVIYYAGQYTFGEKAYLLPYGLVAIVVFIFFVTLLPLLLLGPFQFVNWLTDKPRFEFLRRHWPSIRINIFLDALQGCYKPNRRYFAGIYFLFRLIMFLIFAFSSNEITCSLYQQIFCIVMIILVAFLQPYERKFFNYVDVLIFVNLAIIKAISIYLYTSHIENVRSHYPIGMYVVGSILIWLPLVYMLLYLSWWVVQKFRFYPVIARKLAPLINRLNPLLYYEDSPERRPLLPAARGRMNIDPEPDSLSDAGLFKRAEAPNKYCPPNKPVTRTVVTAYGTSGIADVYETDITGSSGIMSGGTNFSNTNSSRSSGIQSTDSD